MMNINT